MVEKIDDLDELERAIHYLKEAQQLEENDDEDLIVFDAKLNMVDNALDEIVQYVRNQKKNVPFEINSGP